MSASAPTLKVMSSIALTAAWKDLKPALQARGHKIDLVLGTGGAVSRRVAEGEAGDVLVAPSAGMEALEKQGRLVSGSARRVASSGVGFATRKGAPKPDISTREALVRTLLSARCIAYSDPSGGGASGIHFAEVVQRLGIAREVDAKARKAKGALNGEALLSGEADLAVQQIPELLAVQGIEFVGPLPGELQLMTPFSAGVIAATGNFGEAQHVIEFVASEDGARILSAHGFDR